MSDTLLNIIRQKETILVLSLDVTNKQQFFSILKECAPYICALKLHFELYPFLKGNTLKKLIQYSKKHNFIIIEDRKFADIGNTQYLQASEFIKKGISYFTSHLFTGKEALRAFPEQANIFLISDMSCKNAFFSDSIDLRTIFHEKSTDYYNTIPQIIGFVSQYDINKDNNGIILRPGIKLQPNNLGDTMGQQYKDPKITPNVCWVVGRDIYQSDNPKDIAKQYQDIFKKNKNIWLKQSNFSARTSIL